MSAAPTGKDGPKAEVSERLWALPAILLAVVLIYLPALHSHYLHTEDYFWSYWGDFSCSDMISFNGKVGRPALGLLFCASKLMPSIEGMNFFRALSVLNLGGIAYALYRWMRNFKVEARYAALLGVLVVTMPAYVVYCAYLVSAAISVGLTLGIAGFWLTHRAAEGRPVISRPVDLALAVLLLVVSLAIYQPVTLAFCALFTVPLILENETFAARKLRPTAFCAAVLGGSIVLYYLLWRAGLSLAEVPLLGKYDAREFVHDPVERAVWFVQGPLSDVGNLWNIRPGLLLPGLLAVAVLAFAGIDLARARTNRERMMKLASFCGWLLLIPVSYMINLVSVSPSTDYRGYGALTLTLVLGAFLMMYKALVGTRYERFLTLPLAGCLALGAYGASQTLVRNYVIPDSSELSFIKDEIQTWRVIHGDDIAEVHVLTHAGPGIRQVEQRNEIGEPTYPHGPNVRPFIHAALYELGVPNAMDIPVTIDLGGPGTHWEYGREFDAGLGMPGQMVQHDPARTLEINMSAWRS